MTSICPWSLITDHFSAAVQCVAQYGFGLSIQFTVRAFAESESIAIRKLSFGCNEWVKAFSQSCLRRHIVAIISFCIKPIDRMPKSRTLLLMYFFCFRSDATDIAFGRPLRSSMLLVLFCHSMVGWQQPTHTLALQLSFYYNTCINIVNIIERDWHMRRWPVQRSPTALHSYIHGWPPFARMNCESELLVINIQHLSPWFGHR